MKEKEKEKAVVLLSGGLDSAVTLAQAKAMNYDCTALSFNYWQRHKIELEFASTLAAQFKVPLFKVQIAIPRKGCALLDDTLEVTNENCNVPARNLIFLSYAFALTQVIGAYDIFIGANLEDHDTFPDCRREFFDAFEKVASFEADRPIRVQTPFYSTPKKRIVELAYHFEIKLADTWSCYNPQRPLSPLPDEVLIAPCGVCPACKKREAAING